MSEITVERLRLYDAVLTGAKAIYENGPSIGGDTEDGWDAQSEGYKFKARALAHVVLLATESRRAAPQAAEPAGDDDLDALQSWLMKERINLAPLDPDFHAKYEVLKSVGGKVREIRAARDFLNPQPASEGESNA